jgi:hypothetical protein
MSALEVPEPPLPDVQDGVLDADQVNQLFSDLELGADVCAIVYKRRAEEADAAPGPLDLGAARAALDAGRILGVQIHYRHQGRGWCDTLMPVATGVRLIRIARDIRATSSTTAHSISGVVAGAQPLRGTAGG